MDKVGEGRCCKVPGVAGVERHHAAVARDGEIDAAFAVQVTQQEGPGGGGRGHVARGSQRGAICVAEPDADLGGAGADQIGRVVAIDVADLRLRHVELERGLGAELARGRSAQPADAARLPGRAVLVSLRVLRVVHVARRGVALAHAGQAALGGAQRGLAALVAGLAFLDDAVAAAVGLDGL
ncbi:MAG: hypothetical protein IPI49_01050 [Myxococcales bacterium]|nr:hypothetical protein [Myxococcales bacterium]